MLAVSFDATVGLGTFVLGAMLAALAWFFRQWANGLSRQIDNQAADTSGRLDRQDTLLATVNAKADDSRLRIAYLAGSLGVPQTPPLPLSPSGEGLATDVGTRQGVDDVTDDSRPL
jgi:hypothetical protein